MLVDFGISPEERERCELRRSPGGVLEHLGGSAEMQRKFCHPQKEGFQKDTKGNPCI
jgi:hypothetical protein